jgi:hypothetical protein
MVELRDATPADAHAIANVLVQSWRAAYRGLLPDDVLAGLSIPDREQFWSDALTARAPHTRTVGDHGDRFPFYRSALDICIVATA